LEELETTISRYATPEKTSNALLGLVTGSNLQKSRALHMLCFHDIYFCKHEADEEERKQCGKVFFENFLRPALLCFV